MLRQRCRGMSIPDEQVKRLLQVGVRKPRAAQHASRGMCHITVDEHKVGQQGPRSSSRRLPGQAACTLLVASRIAVPAMTDTQDRVVERGVAVQRVVEVRGLAGGTVERGAEPLDHAPQGVNNGLCTGPEVASNAQNAARRVQS